MNGNNITKFMHLLVFHELQRMKVNQALKIDSIALEKTVLLEKHGTEREGKFDFLVQAENKTIGIEVLTRPSHGKLKAKLPYSQEVDQFIFVLPEQAMQLYQKPKGKVFHKEARLNFLSREFKNPKLHAWLLDTKQGTFTEKNQFHKIFNVK